MHAVPEHTSVARIQKAAREQFINPVNMAGGFLASLAMCAAMKTPNAIISVAHSIGSGEAGEKVHREVVALGVKVAAGLKQAGAVVKEIGVAFCEEDDDEDALMTPSNTHELASVPIELEVVD